MSSLVQSFLSWMYRQANYRTTRSKRDEDDEVDEHVWGTTRVTQASKKITEKRLHRPNLIWKDACKRYMTKATPKEDNLTNRAAWRNKIISYTSNTSWRDKPDTKRKEISLPNDKQTQIEFGLEKYRYNGSCLIYESCRITVMFGHTDFREKPEWRTQLMMDYLGNIINILIKSGGWNQAT